MLNKIMAKRGTRDDDREPDIILVGSSHGY